MTDERDMDGLEEAINAEYYSDDTPVWKQRVVDKFAIMLKEFLNADHEYDVSLRMWDCSITLKAPATGGDDE